MCPLYTVYMKAIRTVEPFRSQHTTNCKSNKRILEKMEWPINSISNCNKTHSKLMKNGSLAIDQNIVLMILDTEPGHLLWCYLVYKAWGKQSWQMFTIHSAGIEHYFRRIYLLEETRPVCILVINSWLHIIKCFEVIFSYLWEFSEQKYKFERAN